MTHQEVSSHWFHYKMGQECMQSDNRSETNQTWSGLTLGEKRRSIQMTPRFWESFLIKGEAGLGTPQARHLVLCCRPYPRCLWEICGSHQVSSWVLPCKAQRTGLNYRFKEMESHLHIYMVIAPNSSSQAVGLLEARISSGGWSEVIISSFLSPKYSWPRYCSQ